MKNKTEIASVHVIQLWPLASEGLAMEEIESRERQLQRQIKQRPVKAE